MAAPIVAARSAMATNIISHSLTGLLLDRCEQQRKDAGWVEQQLLLPSTTVMVFDREAILHAPKQTTCFLPLQDVRTIVPDLGQDLVFLGVTTASSVASASHAITAKRFEKEVAERHKDAFASNGWEWMNIRQYLSSAMMSDSTDVSALVGLGKSMTHWHATSRYCTSCGSPTAVSEGGMSRTCTKCEEKSYPRINPCAIMLVLDGEGRCLLGKGKGRPFYTTLAGFMSHGESAEETVVREVQEESGVGVSRVHYHSSQPWPFPFQLMLGYHAYADPNRRTIVADPHEMDDVIWVSKEDVRLALSHNHPTMVVPPALSISHQLMKAWAVDGTVDDAGAPRAAVVPQSSPNSSL